MRWRKTKNGVSEAKCGKSYQGGESDRLGQMLLRS